MIDDNLYERIGGHDTFVKLVTAFYDGVSGDPVLRPMYPDDELDGAIWRLTAFLEQYWGGPGMYSENRGHPRLRMRHSPFAVTPDARERWLHHMTTALGTLGLSPLDHATMLDYFDRAATAMLNTGDDDRGDRPSLL
ncbi:MAG: globin [Microbacteriaceae bacterium]